MKNICIDKKSLLAEKLENWTDVALNSFWLFPNFFPHHQLVFYIVPIVRLTFQNYSLSGTQAVIVVGSFPVTRVSNGKGKVTSLKFVVIYVFFFGYNLVWHIFSV